MKKIIPLLLTLCIIAPQLGFSGAWTLPKNNVWVETSAKYSWAKYDYSSQHDLTRKSWGIFNGTQFDKTARTWGLSISPKFEYGLLDWITLLGGVEYKDNTYKEYLRPSSWGPYTKSARGVTTIDVGARVRFVEKPVVVSGQIKYIMYSGTGDDLNPALHDGNNSLDLRLMAGKKFETDIPFYLAGELGYRFNNRRVSDQIPFFLEGGFWPIDWLLIKSEIDGVWANEHGDKIEKEYAIWRIGPSFQLLDLYNILTGNNNESVSGNDITRAGNSFNIDIQYGNTFWGKNTSADQEAIVKVSTQF